MAEKLALLSEEARTAMLAQFSDEEWDALEYDWNFWSRPSQQAPLGNWLGWLIMTGRGWGKNRTAAEFCVGEIRANRSSRSGFIARTGPDMRDVVIEGESGIMRICPPDFRPLWEPSKRRLSWPNGAITHTYSADEPDVLRGPQHDLIWGDELAAWKFREAWTNAMFGLRMGLNPRWIATTTPKVTPLMKSLLLEAKPREQYENMSVGDQRGAIILSGGSTYENLANLAPAFIKEVIRRAEGTRIAKQEIYGKMLEDSPDALWKRQQLEDDRVIKAPPLRNVVVAVDPAASASEDSSETGIMVCGVDEAGHGYLIEDSTIKGKPEQWGAAAVAAFHKHQANRIIAETNNGGDMVISVIMAVDKMVPTKKITASRAKYTRAEPVAALYAQHIMHHVGYYAELEDQLCLWVPGEESPDRLDALVWAFSDLLVDLKAKVYGRDFGIA
jgi:phage terminase large subunit-like protein